VLVAKDEDLEALGALLGRAHLSGAAHPLPWAAPLRSPGRNLATDWEALKRHFRKETSVDLTPIWIIHASLVDSELFGRAM